MTVPLDRHKNFPSAYIQSRQVDVWLPPTYQSNPDKRYGVLYMHDGQNLFDPAISNTKVDWGVIPALEKLAASGDILEEVIVVGIWCTDQRMAEYLPQRPFETLEGQRRLEYLKLEVSDGPYSDNYLRFLVEELKPFIDGRYRTIQSQNHTYIMGSSMGGLISLYALCQYPDIFCGAGCLSTHWPVVDGVILDYLTEYLPQPGYHRLYFDHGTEMLDALYQPYQNKVDDLIRSKGYQAELDWVTRRFEGAVHNEQAWRDRIDIPLTFLLRSLPS
jgi:predicted alpha/beta superfamily hydrolase